MGLGPPVCVPCRRVYNYAFKSNGLKVYGQRCWHCTVCGADDTKYHALTIPTALREEIFGPDAPRTPREADLLDLCKGALPNGYWHLVGTFRAQETRVPEPFAYGVQGVPTDVRDNWGLTVVLSLADGRFALSKWDFAADTYAPAVYLDSEAELLQHLRPPSGDTEAHEG